MGRPNQTHERLDALLDGRPAEVTDDLAPLLEAAESLRAELAQFELDPEVADRHLERVLNGSAPVVPLPVRQGGGGPRGPRGLRGLRRRVAVMALAAALVLVPATMASAASSDALPGQVLYSVKLAVEQVRLASVQWSLTLEAQERAKLAAKRLDELHKLIKLRMFHQIPPAIRALDKAVVAAHEAVEKAIAEEGRDPELVAAAGELEAVKDAKSNELVALRKIVSQLPPANQAAIKLAVQQSQVITASLPPVLAPAPATTAAPNSTAPPDTGGGVSPGSGPATTEAALPPSTQPEPPPPPTTAPPPPPSTEPATTETTVTTVTTPTTAASPNQGNPSGAEGSEEPPTSSTSPN
jgi:hypothetical protein